MSADRPNDAGDGSGAGARRAPSPPAVPSAVARRWLERLPDDPLWVDLRGFLGSGQAEIVEAPSIARPGGEAGEIEMGAVVRMLEEPVAFVVDHPGEAALALLDGVDEVLTPIDQAAFLTERLSDWSRDDATLHVLSADVDLSAPGWAAPSGGPEPPTSGAVSGPGDETVTVRLVNPDERASLEDGKLAVAYTVDLARSFDRGRPVSVAFVDDVPAAFLAATVETEGYWDVVVETAEPYRRRGLARACFRPLHRWFLRLGKEPVWGAHGSNPASMALARQLGFVPHGQLAVFVAPGARA